MRAPKMYYYETSKSEEVIKDIWNQTYNVSRGQVNYQLSDPYGKGQVTGLEIDNGIKMIHHDITFSHEVALKGTCYMPHIDLLFCLGEAVDFDLLKSQQHFHMAQGDTYMGMSKETEKYSLYRADTALNMIEIKLPVSLFENFFNHNRPCKIDQKSLYEGGWSLHHPLSYDVKYVLEQLINPPQDLPLIQLYKAAKIQEILALYLSEVFYEDTNGTSNKLSEFTQWDLKCIHHARQFLLENMDKNLTIESLSRVVGLNEYKLKKGFKIIFGQTIHAFFIEAKMKRASRLLQNSTVSISQIAYELGYNNVSHFSSSFKRIYKRTPRDYRKFVLGL